MARFDFNTAVQKIKLGIPVYQLGSSDRVYYKLAEDRTGKKRIGIFDFKNAFLAFKDSFTVEQIYAENWLEFKTRRLFPDFTTAAAFLFKDKVKYIQPDDDEWDTDKVVGLGVDKVIKIYCISRRINQRLDLNEHLFLDVSWFEVVLDDEDEGEA